MDINEVASKANPNIVLVLDYLAVGVLLGALYYAAIVAKVVDPTVAVTAVTGVLTALGVYKVSN